MKYWVTEIQAIDPQTRSMALWAGPNVPGINLQDAERYCQLNGLGYCAVIGELIGEGEEDSFRDIETINNN